MNKIIVQKDQARLYGRPYPIPQGQSQFSEIEFSFSEEWANLRKIAQFEQKSGPYNVDISDNKCFCPSELVKGWVNIRVKGYPEDTTSAVIATANEIILPVSVGFKSGGTPPVPPTPDLYQKLIGEFSDKVQSNWAQNDPTAKDYVRNRTHYVSQESKALVPEQDVTPAEQDNVNFAILNNADLDALQTLLSSDDDTTFDVVFDGASYPCKWLEQGGNRIPFFGNLAIFDPRVTDTGEPFAFAFEGVEQGIVIAYKVAGTHTVAVNYQQNVVHTLDPKYIKDMYYSAIEEKNIAGMKITGTTYDGTEHDPLPFVLGQVWNAEFVTTSYNDLHVKQADDGTLYIGDLGLSSPPFFVSVTSGGANSAWENNMQPGGLTLIGVSGTVGGKVVHTLPDEYLSANIARKSDIPENRIMIITARGINADVNFGDYTDVLLLIKAATPGQLDLRILLVNGKNKHIINCKTGSAVVDGEQPYGVMAIMCDVVNDTYTLLNPL